MVSPEREVHRTLVALGFIRDASVTRGARYTGSIPVSGRSLRCAIVLDDFEFARLPRLQLPHANEDLPELIAHLEQEGGYCYANRDQYVLDHFNPREAMLQSLQLMRASLERSLTRHAQPEIEAEFPQHWFGISVYVDLKQPSQSAPLYIVGNADKSEKLVLADTPRVAGLLDGFKPKSCRRVGLIRTSRTLTFTASQTRPNTLSEFLTWLSSIDPALGPLALSRLRKESDNPRTVFIFAPNGVVGAQVQIPPIWKKAIEERPQSMARFLDKRRDALGIQRMFGEPIDPDFLYSRNMRNKKSFAGLSITLVGCGTIGSHLAKMLAQSGAGYGEKASLTLIDEQQLKPGNIGRHLLGVPDIGRNKAVAVRDELLRLYPGLKISAIGDDTLKRLDGLLDDQLVIDATGDEGVANAINARLLGALRDNGKVPATIYAWLFGNGAAAQSLFWDSMDFACYRCLKPEHGGNWRFNPLKTEYQLETVAAQCGEGAYLPYGVSSSVLAASIAFQTALDWLNGGASPRLRTQRISSDRTQQVKDQDPSRSPRCPACGNENA